MDDVKDYLEKKKDLSWESLTKRNSWVLIMAVQIALKKLGYDFGKVDWILADKGKTVSKTKNAIKAFQQANSLSPDGIPGPKTITKIVEALNALPQQQWRTPPVFKSYWPQK
jgi:peptidoglycan hydrolase-like protein with peptidoglycan-binding domain